MGWGEFGVGVSGDERALDSLKDEVAEITARLRRLEVSAIRANAPYVNIADPNCPEAVHLIQDCNILGILGFEEEWGF